MLVLLLINGNGLFAVESKEKHSSADGSFNLTTRYSFEAVA